MKCLYCYTGDMVRPQDDHPSYLVCSTCNAIELTYQPQDYQSASHCVPYIRNDDGTLQMQIIGYFGG